MCHPLLHEVFPHCKPAWHVDYRSWSDTNSINYDWLMSERRASSSHWSITKWTGSEVFIGEQPLCMNSAASACSFRSKIFHFIKVIQGLVMGSRTIEAFALSCIFHYNLSQGRQRFLLPDFLNKSDSHTDWMFDLNLPSEVAVSWALTEYYMIKSSHYRSPHSRSRQEDICICVLAWSLLRPSQLCHGHCFPW